MLFAEENAKRVIDLQKLVFINALGTLLNPIPAFPATYFPIFFRLLVMWVDSPIFIGKNYLCFGLCILIYGESIQSLRSTPTIPSFEEISVNKY